MTYALIDSGNQKKLENFGGYILMRPCAQALWQPNVKEEVWKKAHAEFTREEGNRWNLFKELPKEWEVTLEGLKFRIVPTDFGHLGVFPEHSTLWPWLEARVSGLSFQPKVLNLFAYSGGATLALARSGTAVCHVDASKGMVQWARDNARLNRLDAAPIRWIVDDVVKFLMREIRRGSKYEGIILDPPSFGRGAKGEVFKIERDLPEILKLCAQLLSDKALFLVLTAHTPGVSPLILSHVMEQILKGRGGDFSSGELVIPSAQSLSLPSGFFARWNHG